MGSHRWISATIAVLTAVCLGCTGSAPQTSSSSPALPIFTSTPTAVVGAVRAASTPGAARPSAGVPPPGAPSFGNAQPPTPAGTAFASQVLFQQQGAATSQQPAVDLHTNAFTTPGSWDLHWQYNCNALGRAGNLGIDVYRANGSYVNTPPSLMQLGSGGQGTQEYSLAGQFYLQINSVCSWAVSVTTAARPTAVPLGSGAAPVGAAAQAAAAAAPAAPGAAQSGTTAVNVTTGGAAAAATPTAAAAAAAAAPAATVVGATVATATPTSAASSAQNSGLEALAGGRPVILPSISTPIPPIEQAQGVFAANGATFSAPAATPPSITFITPIPRSSSTPIPIITPNH
jgi:hypothetical protein